MKILKILQGMSGHQKLGMILESKVVQKCGLENFFFTKNLSPKLIIFYDFF